MRHDKISVLTVVFLSALALAFAPGEQTKPAVKPQTQIVPAPQTRPGTQPLEKSRALQIQQAQDEQHKAVVGRVFVELFSQGRYEAIPQIYAPGCVVHFRNKISRLDESVAEGKGWRMAAPDLQMTDERMSVMGDVVTVDWIARGTHTGRGNGLQPSGKRILVRGSSRFRMVNGKIAEVWNEYNRDDLFRQIGVNPKLGYLYDMTQDFVLAMNRIFFSQQY